MLGIGNGLYKTKPPMLKLLATYTSDFTSSVDSWSVSSNTEGTLTLTSNQTAPGSGEAGWLKGTYDSDQTNPSDIQRASGFSVRPGDYFSASFKIYLDNPGASLGTYWDGTDDVDGGFTVLAGRGNANDIDAIPQEQVVTRDHHNSPVGPTFTSNSTILFRLTSSPDTPKANAVFYVKDIVIKHYRYIY